VVAFDLSIDMVNASSDSSVFAWASSVATFGAALLLCLLAIVRPTRPWPSLLWRVRRHSCRSMT
jgi:hypothetical protein